MKLLTTVLLAVVLCAAAGIAQTNGTISGGTQGVSSGMAGGPHDFTSTRVDSINHQSWTGPTDFLCGYCHVPHTSSAQSAPVPLWGRKSLKTGTSHTGITFGYYTSNTMNSTDIATPNAVDDGNYSSLCLSCHDGSQAFASSAYQSKPVPFGTAWPGAAHVGFDTIRLPSFMNMSTTGSYGGLSHIHPVNMTYPASDPGLFTPADPTNYAYLDGDLKVGRLFNGKVQCSSCHNPHIKESYSTGDQYPLIQGTLAGGKLCIACHKK